MLVAIATAGWALRKGLLIRNERRRRARRTRALRDAHLRVAKPAIVLVLIGFVAGSASAVWLRGWSLLSSVHAWMGLVAAALFVGTALYGRRLERGRMSATETHAVLGLLAVLAAALAAVAGFALLA